MNAMSRGPKNKKLWDRLEVSPSVCPALRFHFYRVVGASILAIDELRTVAYEISAILHTRPLCPISENAETPDVLAPAHFLKGSSYTTFPEPNITHLREGRLSRWQRVTQMQQHFWKGLSSEYLSLLQERSKWRVETSNITVRSIALMKEDNGPPLRWQLERIQEVIPGGEGVIRVAMVDGSDQESRRQTSRFAHRFRDSWNLTSSNGGSMFGADRQRLVMRV